MINSPNISGSGRLRRERGFAMVHRSGEEATAGDEAARCQAARAAVLAAVVAIDGDIRKMARASAACRRLMSIPGVGEAAT